MKTRPIIIAMAMIIAISLSMGTCFAGTKSPVKIDFNDKNISETKSSEYVSKEGTDSESDKTTQKNGVNKTIKSVKKKIKGKSYTFSIREVLPKDSTTFGGMESIEIEKTHYYKDGEADKWVKQQEKDIYQYGKGYCLPKAPKIKGYKITSVKVNVKVKETYDKKSKPTYKDNVFYFDNKYETSKLTGAGITVKAKNKKITASYKITIKETSGEKYYAKGTKAGSEAYENSYVITKTEVVTYTKK